MGIMEPIKKGFGVATKNLGLVAILFLFNLLWNLGSIPFARTAPAAGAAGTTPATPPISAGAAIFSIVFILCSIFFQGGTLGIVKDYIKTGAGKLASLISYGFKYYLRLLGLGIFIVLVVLIAGLVAALIIAASNPVNNAVVTVIAAIIAIIIGAVALFYVFLLVLAPYALICDDLGVVQAIKKSMNSVRKALGRVLLLLVLLILISLGVGFVVGFLTGIATFAVPAATGQIIIGIVNSAVNSYLGVVMMGAFMVFYLSLTQKERPLAEKV